MKKARIAVAAERCRLRGKTESLKGNGPMVYLMRKDIRVNDNWSLLRCQEEARPTRVAHVLEHEHPSYRLAWFYYRGLEEVQEVLKGLNIPLDVIKNSKDLPGYLKDINASGMVADLHSLREFDLKPVIKICDDLSIPLWEVDSHNIVPVWVASDKQEYAARTIRPKINKKLKDWLVDIPSPASNLKEPKAYGQTFDADKILVEKWEKKDAPSIDFIPGSKAGKEALQKFLPRLSHFDHDRNDPTKDALSNLSPWFRHGHLSKQRVALEVKASSKSSLGLLEELIVRGELAENYTFYNPNYDNLKGAPAFGQKTLKDHEKDKREYLYTYEQLEFGKTHDNLWNAAQRQLVDDGKMHGFMRMYWAKKILEWTESPTQALEYTIKLNDTYSMDGRDPRGYVGMMWSIAGLHDQGWRERPVFGKIRYMNYAGCKRKFDVDEYIRKHPSKKSKTYTE